MEYLGECRLVEEGYPTENGRELLMRIPIEFVNTIRYESTFLSATKIIGGIGNQRSEDILTESGCIIVEMRENGPEVSGTLEPGFVMDACWLAGNGNMRIGDVLVIATSDEAPVSVNTSISVALRAA